MFRHVAIIRLDPWFGRKNTFCATPCWISQFTMIEGGGTRSRFTVMCGGFGVCWVWRMLVVGPLAWRLQALL
jgi:hypothetical protein